MLTQDIGKHILYSDGRIWSKWKKTFMKQSSSRHGYFQICIDRKRKHVHILLAKAFIPNPDNLLEINHLNGVKSDNRIENLEWSNRSKNMKHAYDTGLRIRPNGDLNGRAKLTKDQVKEIRKIYPSKTMKELGKIYGVSNFVIGQIVNYKSWKDV
jgi:hypothetical protein